jgi:hypothetical protein
MHKLTRTRSPPCTSPATTTPELGPGSLPPSPSPKAQGLKFFRTFSTRPLPTNDTGGTNSWETSPRAAARGLRGWFGSPPSPICRKAEEQEDYRWRYLDEGKEWEGFLRSVEDDGGLGVPPPRSPISFTPLRAKNNERRRRRSDPKSSDWDAAMLAHARSLGYSCPSSPSDFGSNGSVESLTSASSGWSSTHSPSMSVFSPSIRVAAHYRPMRSPSSSCSGGRREPKRPIASEDFAALYFAGVGRAEGSMLDGLRRGPKLRRNEPQSPVQQNALGLEVGARPQPLAENLRPAEPTFAVYPPSSPAPPRTRSPTPHRTFRPSPLRPRSSSSVESEGNKRFEDPSTDFESVRHWKSKRRRNTTDGLTTIWEMASCKEGMKSGVVDACDETEARNEA